MGERLAETSQAVAVKESEEGTFAKTKTEEEKKAEAKTAAKKMKAENALKKSQKVRTASPASRCGLKKSGSGL